MRCKCTEYKRDAEGGVEAGEVKDMKCLSFLRKTNAPNATDMRLSLIIETMRAINS